MKSHVWYPQFDVIDSIRRFVALLLLFKSPPGVERLCIADFFLANPPLLHNTVMTAEMRKVFSELNVVKPEKSFLTYPSPPLLFKRMEPTQRDALSEMIGKGVLSVEGARTGSLQLARTPAIDTIANLCTADEGALGRFIVGSFLGPEDVGNRDLKRRTGLSRVS